MAEKSTDTARLVKLIEIAHIQNRGSVAAILHLISSIASITKLITEANPTLVRDSSYNEAVKRLEQASSAVEKLIEDVSKVIEDAKRD